LPDLAQSTAYWYRCLLDAYVFRHPIGVKPIAELSDRDINLLVKELKERPTRSGKPLSKRSINAVLARLRTILSVAQRRKLIAEDPMVYVDNLDEAKPEVDPFDLSEARALLQGAQGWERAFLAVLLFGGLRPNEALALRWSDIDWRNGAIWVKRNLTRFGFGDPKTHASKRDVPMMGPVREALTEQRPRSELRGELVFPDSNGGPFDLANFRHRNWPRILRRAGVRPRTLYQCRHTFARLFLERGEGPQWVARALGHSSVQMVFQVYGRWCAATNLESRARATLEADLSALYLPKVTGTSGKVREVVGNESQQMVVRDGTEN
jgi:integrase